MHTFQILAIIQLIAAPILLIVALAVRLAGNSQPLNIVDYSRVGDRAALHRWAGNRLLLLPFAFGTCGIVSLLYPRASLSLFLLTTLSVIGLAIALAIGANKFQSAA